MEHFLPQYLPLFGVVYTTVDVTFFCCVNLLFSGYRALSVLLAKDGDIYVARGVGFDIFYQCIGTGTYIVEVVVECRVVDEAAYTAVVADQCTRQNM